MKKLNIFLTLALLVCGVGMNAQTVNVPFKTSDAGKSLPINWGMDAAWDWDYNVMRGIAHYGTNFTTGRISFQPYNLVDVSKIDDASANFGLSAGQVRKLQWRIDLIKRTGATKVNINCDHEVLVRAMDDEGNYGAGSKVGEVNDNVGKGNYVSTNGTITKTQEWVNLIKATVKYAQTQGLEVISVSPFNESDYGWNQYYTDRNGANETNQNRYGIPTFKAIAKAIKEDPFFNGIRVCGGNTLNCDRAAVWYDGLKDYLDEGNTHQLAGSFDNYASFFKKVRDDGKVATADEVHNVGEAMVGVEYGMQNAIWWGFDSKARGQFMHDSNEGKRIGYAEDRSHWTSAAVYRNDKDGEIHGFIGSSERQANVSTYNFQCQDREVYFNGYGPQKEWSVTTIGGASGSYQNGQINYEYLFDITYGEDVQSAPINGNYQIMSAADMKLVTSNGAWNGGNHLSAAAQANSNTQHWHVYPGRSDGDCSYWFIDNVGDATQHWNLLNGGGAGAMAAGSRVICYNAGHDALEQWYLRYAKDGYFYIMARQSNKYLYNDNGTLTLQDAPTKSTGANTLKKYMWRLMPTDATAEQTAPAAPSGLAEGTSTSASANISWTAVTGESKAVTYNVLRQDANGWNTIARLQSGTNYTDTKVEAGKAYNYKVQAVDYSGNRSEMSDVVMVMVPEDSEDVPTYTAGQWEWLGETAAAGNYYIKSVAHGTYLNTSNGMDAAANTLWTLTASRNNWDIASGEKHISMTRSGSFISYSYTNNTGAASGTVALASSKNISGAYMITGTYGSRYLNQTSSSAISTNSTATSDANTTTWYLISENQMAEYAKVSDYTTAFNTAKGFLSMGLSSELMNELTSTLDACDGTINYQNIGGYITNLNTIIDECRTYIEENPSTPEEERTDFTGLIINPTIIQNGTTNDAPTGWMGASTNVTGNGHWTEGTGNTRLEAWNWSTNANGLSVDYYQDIIVPNGLYSLSAVTHQRANGDAALYAETYKSFEATMPVGDGNEAKTDVTTILVTDGCIRIGIKASNDYTGENQWMTADNFTLTRVSTPENTALSHYKNAVEYLNGLANVELNRNVDHTELNAARGAANSCEANANAYSKAINNYIAAIKRSQAMEELPTAEVGADMTSMAGPWIGQTGIYNTIYVERYNDNVNIPKGKALYQYIEELPRGDYKVQFYAVANFANHAWLPELNSGAGIAQVFAQDQTDAITVNKQTGCDPSSALYEFTVSVGYDGVLQFGIENVKEGGNWYVAQTKSITYLGIKHDANLKVRANVYGTFVAPYDVTLPEGIIAYQAKRGESSVKLTKIAEGDETLSARTPVILKNTTDADIIKDYSDYCNSESLVSDGVLAGFLQKDQIVPNGAYVLQDQNDGNGQMFYKVVSAFTGVQNRCYLVATSTNGVKVLNFEFADEEETLIEDLPSVEVASEYYSVNGVKLSKPQKGINIVRMSDGTVRKVMER